MTSGDRPTPTAVLLAAPRLMSRSPTLTLVTATAVLLAACGGARAPRYATGPEADRARARADSIRAPYVRADIDFMSGMIHHHAQAIVMSRLAPTRGASPAVIRLTERIINAQTDEIKMMQTWLGDRSQAVPQVDAGGKVTMPGMAMEGHTGHTMGGAATLMPGMLSDAQLKELEAARGETFDQFFLVYMIQHHRGAVAMVRTLYATPGAGQDLTMFKFAADVETDQSTEITRMLTMLYESPTPPTQRSPE